MRPKISTKRKRGVLVGERRRERERERERESRERAERERERGVSVCTSVESGSTGRLQVWHTPLL